jgi:phage head maturation protease
LPDVEDPEQPETGEDVIVLELPQEQLQTLSTKDRKLGIRIVPFGVVAEHPAYGALMFEAGAFGEVDARSVRLRMDHQDPPTGLGSRYWEEPDGAYMEFQLSKTSRADDQLTLAVDGVSRGASVGFHEVIGRAKRQKIGGRQVTVYGPDSARLAELSTTWMPTFPEAGVMYALSKQEGEGPMAENDPAPVIEPGIDYDALANVTASAIDRVLTAQRDASSESKIEKMLERFDEMIELQRSAVTIPADSGRPKPKLHHWVELTLKRMAGQPLRPEDIRELALDDVVTTEQPGLVPVRFTPDYDDLLDASRPFLNSTREIEPPATGNSMVLPIITTRAVAGTQAGNAEKGALTTTATKVGTGTFAYKPIFGGADISMQMILRSERSFFDLLTGDMAEAYALDAEAKAIAALLAGYTDSASVAHAPEDGGTLDPEDPHFGDAWQTSILASKRAPTHIWMSAAAVGAFIDAKAPVTNAPLYSTLAGDFTAGGGAGGRLSGLIPVYVPALDAEDVDVIVGPSRGFVWAEDPARRLEADRPDVAGRDIAIVGGLFPAPRYADAFTTYVIAGS